VDVLFSFPRLVRCLLSLKFISLGFALLVVFLVIAEDECDECKFFFFIVVVV
jgi:hypothetical protein